MAGSVTGDATEGYQFSARQAHGVSTFQARAIVGADARRSVVRQAADIAFEGHDNSLSAMMGDVRLNDLDGPPLRMVSNARGGVTIAPVTADGVMRVIVIDPQRMHVPIHEPLSLEELESSTRRILGKDVGMSDPTWLSRFGNETRLAAHYRSGNLFDVLLWYPNGLCRGS